MSGLEVYSHVESMHDRIMSLRGMENNNSLTPPLFIEVLVPKKKGNERLCICVLCVSSCVCFYDFKIGLWICSDSVIFFVLHFLL